MEASKTNPRTCVLPWCNRNSDEGRSFSRLPTDTKFRAHLKCHKSVDNDPFFARSDVLEGKEMRVCREHIPRAPLTIGLDGDSLPTQECSDVLHGDGSHKLRAHR
jgi:hypothetical protein